MQNQSNSGPVPFGGFEQTYSGLEYLQRLRQLLSSQPAGHSWPDNDMGFRSRRARRRLYGETGEASFELEGEVMRRDVPYAKWVQASLNKIMGLQLAVDGDIGPGTRSAIRAFQQRSGFGVNGIDGDVGPRTERALIAGGASPPPSGTSGAIPPPVVTPPNPRFPTTGPAASVRTA